MKKNTRAKLLEEAELQFSKRGFYGTSINDIAKAVGVSKQGLLHHFNSKEQLYGDVLENASMYITYYVNHLAKHAHSLEQELQTVFAGMINAEGRAFRVIMLLFRELLDNHERASSAKKWYLRPFLDVLVSKAKHLDDNRNEAQAFALIYQLLGATQYFLMSKVTLLKLYTSDEFEAQMQAFEEQINALCEPKSMRNNRLS